LYSTFRNMQLPTVSEHGAELEGKMGKLDISRNQPGPQPGPSQIDHSTRSLTGTDGASGSSSQHHRRRDQARSSSQSSEGGVRKTSKGEVWYLKTIVFTSPSGVRRKYNIITQNYNGCVIGTCHTLVRWLICRMRSGHARSSPYAISSSYENRLKYFPENARPCRTTSSHNLSGSTSCSPRRKWTYLQRSQ
jgi:hypothetical protein